MVYVNYYASVLVWVWQKVKMEKWVSWFFYIRRSLGIWEIFLAKSKEKGIICN